MPAAPGSTLDETPEGFQAELEFINALASPDYLSHLSQQRTFESDAFLRYLKDLHSCWSQPAYAQYVIYPHALCFLELLQVPEFRSRIGTTAFKEAVHAQQFYAWAFSLRRRLEAVNAKDTSGTKGVDPEQHAV